MRSGRVLRQLKGVPWALMLGLLSSCAATPKEEFFLRPGRQPFVQSRVAGDRIVYRAPDVIVVVEVLDPGKVGLYYREKKLPNPFVKLPLPQPVVFLLSFENRSQKQLHLDPQEASLVDQENRRTASINSGELYLTFSEEEDAPLLASLQATLLDSFMILQPKGKREGLLLFPHPEKRPKALRLELSSFYVGAEAQPLIFSFDVVGK